MLAVVLIAIVIVVAIVAHRTSRGLDAATVRRTLAVFAAAILLERTFVRLALPHHAGWLPAAVGAGMIAWAAMVRLVAFDARRRDIVVRSTLGGLALATAAIGSVQVPAFFVAQGVLRYAWTRLFGTRTLFWLALGSAALLAAVFWVGDPRGGEFTGAAGTEFAFLRFSMIVTDWFLAIGAIALLRAFVRDPSLGIRTVGHRLGLSHVLVVGIPLVLLGGLWMVTTLLGVQSDRAMVAARAIEAEGRGLERRLSDAQEDPRGAVAGLRTLAAREGAAWRGARIWRVEGRTTRLVLGDTLGIVPSFTSWTDSLGRRRGGAFTFFDGRGWYAAAARDPADSARAAVLFLPDSVVLKGDAARVTSAALSVSLQAVSGGNGSVTVGPGSAPAGDARLGPAGRSAVAAPSALSHADSLELERVRRVTRHFGIPDSLVAEGRRTRTGGLRVTTPDDTIEIPRAQGGVLHVLTDGHALAPGLHFERGNWVADRVLLSAHVTPDAVLAGLYRNLSENPVGYLPIILIGLVTLLVVLVVIFDLTMVTNMARSITGAIGSLKTGARRLEEGDLAHRIEVRGEDDLWDVADAFNQAVAGLERARELEKERARMEGELALARQIQSRLLPPGPPHVKGFEIAGHYDPARQVGGDYYDHLVVDDHRVLLVIADVSGKGVPASLLMSGFRASLMSQDLAPGDPVALAEHLNDFLVRSVEMGKFVTSFLAFADARAGTLDYVNAGHNPPVLLRADGTHELLNEGGTMFGIMPGAPFTAGRVRFAPGDLLVLYTDGVTEGAGENGELWGDERLLETVASEAARPCADLAATIAGRVRTFEGDFGRADDVTLLVTRRVAD